MDVGEANEDDEEEEKAERAAICSCRPRKTMGSTSCGLRERSK